MESNGKQISIKGILIPADWDAKGNVVKGAILTPDEGEYIVEENDKGKKMLGLLQQMVEIIGVVRKEAGKKIIKVQKFQQAKRQWD